MTGNTGDQTLTGGKDKNGPPEIDRMAVKIAHLDRLLGLTGEIIITASNISILQRHLAASAVGIDKSSIEMVKNAALTANRISSDLHHLVMDIRMVPIRDTFLRFRRLVRDIAKKKGRQVNFEVVGENTLVDKTVTEKLYEPLAHQIRNAIDHGLEDPLERQRGGKEPTGNLVLTAYKKEGFTYVSVSDDGRGLNESRILQVAVEKGLLSSAATINKSECWNLIMQPGFSTTSEATEISGRGVGMDVVKNTVESLGGEVIIETSPGRGTVFTYKIPQLSAVNITDALIIRIGGGFCAVPIGNVVATQSVDSKDIITAMDCTESIQYLGSILPLHDLRSLLAGPPLEGDEDTDTLPVIIIDAKNGRIALKVSEFIRPQKLVIIPLPEIFSVLGVSGTTILGGNQLGMVIDPFELIALATDSTRTGGAEGAFSVDIFGEIERMSLVDTNDSQASKSQPEDISSGEGAEFLGETEGTPRTSGIDEGVAEEFFIEIQNILTELNEDIFQMEKEPDNVRRLNTIFRHFHSIKGNLIMTGFVNAGAFVHEVETVLDRIREKELTVTQEIIDLLLDAVKNLEGGLAQIRSGYHYEVTDAELLATVASYRIQDSGKTSEDVAEVDNEAFHLSPLANILYYSKLTRGEVGVFQSFIKVGSSFQDPSLVVYLILKRLAEIGDLMDTVPSLDKIERGVAVSKMKILFSSPHSLEEVNRFFKAQLVKYFNIVEFDNLLLE